MSKLLKQMGVGAVAAVLMLAVQAWLLNRPPEHYDDLQPCMVRAEAAIQAALDSDQSTAGQKPRPEVTVDAVARTAAGIHWWSARSLADTADLYLQRRWSPDRSRQAELGATMRALRRVTQGQELARAMLATDSTFVWRSISAVFYGWAQWAALSLLLVVALLGVGADRMRLSGLALSARAAGVLCGLTVVLGAAGFLVEVSGALGEAASEAGLRSGLGRALHPLVVGLVCSYVANLLSPKAEAVAAGAVNVANAANANVEGMRDAVKFGMLDATLVIVKGVEKNA